eukprot:gene3641-biopygen2239
MPRTTRRPRQTGLSVAADVRQILAAARRPFMATTTARGIFMVTTTAREPLMATITARAPSPTPASHTMHRILSAESSVIRPSAATTQTVRSTGFATPL